MDGASHSSIALAAESVGKSALDSGTASRKVSESSAGCLLFDSGSSVHTRRIRLASPRGQEILRLWRRLTGGLAAAGVSRGRR